MSDPYADIEAALAAHNALLRADWQSAADMARIMDNAAGTQDKDPKSAYKVAWSAARKAGGKIKT